MQKIGVLIVDDHPAVRLGLEAILNHFEDIGVLATAGSGDYALDLCRRIKPNVVLVDIHMPGMDGIETIAAFKRDHPAIRTIALTHSEEDETVVKAVEAGAIGYLHKTAEVTTIADAIRAAAVGRRWLSPEALEAIIHARTAPPVPPDTELTEREVEVLALMVKGQKNPQIAEALHVSVSTVKFHVGVIFRKLGATTRTEAVVIALDRGIVLRQDS